MQIKLSAALAVGTLAIACSSHSAKAPGSEEKSIIGSNEFVVEQDSTLRQLVGRLSLADKSCTAFVTGTSEITTAAHCLQIKDEISSLKFTSASGITTSITKIVELEPTKDRLILGTEESFQNSLAKGLIQGNSLKLVGYDSVKNDLFTTVGCQFEKRISGSGSFSHSCDTIPGMSGSPILQNGRVVGIHLGYMEKIERNAAYEVALAGEKMTDVSVLGVTNEWGHVKVNIPHIRNVIPELPTFSFNGVFNQIGGLVGKNPDFVRAAVDGGWTSGNCQANGTMLSTSIAALYSTPICLAVGAALATGPCLAAVVASGAAITAIACTQLCNDRHLRGAECGNP